MNGRTAPRCLVVTGASSGLGAALALRFAAPGVILGLIGRDAARLGHTGAACEQKGAAVENALLDVGDGLALAAWLKEFDASHAVDLVIANAGIAMGPQSDRAAEGSARASRVIETNLLGIVHTVEPLIERMLARGRGHVAVVSSVAGYRGLPDSPAYCASKAGVRIYGESLRTLLEPAGIAVSVIVPGFFASPMSDNFLGPRPLMVSSERAARTVHRGLLRRRRRIVFPLGAGLLLQTLDLLPAALGDFMVRSYRFRIAERERGG